MLTLISGRQLVGRLFIEKLTKCLFSSTSSSETKKMDKLFRSVELEVRGHDKAVIRSYTTFVKNVCIQLNLESSPVVRFPYIKWIQYALRAKFAKKKYKLHYETRTHISRLSIFYLTGSTASTFLEYIERNIPEGVAMKVTYEELAFFPDTIKLQSK